MHDSIYEIYLWMQDSTDEETTHYLQFLHWISNMKISLLVIVTSRDDQIL